MIDGTAIMSGVINSFLQDGGDMSDRMIPEHFNTLGKPKKPYYTLFEAESAAWLSDMDCYECSFCGYWHLSKKERQREK